MEQSTAAYDQREELCTKLQQLKDKSQNDKLAHVQVGDMTALSLISRRLINFSTGNEGVAEKTGSRCEITAILGRQRATPRKHRIGSAGDE